MLTDTTVRTKSDDTRELAAQSADAAPATQIEPSQTAPVLDNVIARVGNDCCRDAEGYLQETEVPHGGE